MTAPWGVIFDENVLSFIHNNIIPVETDELVDGKRLFLWDGLTLNVLGEASSLEVFEKLDHILGAELITIEDELLEVSGGWVDDPELWEITSDSDVISKPLVETIYDTRGGHEDAALKFRRGLLKVSAGLLASLTIFSEEEHARLTTAEDQLGGLLVEWHDGWDGVGADPSVDLLGGQKTFIVISAFVELFEETDGNLSIRDVGTELSGEGLVGDVVED